MFLRLRLFLSFLWCLTAFAQSSEIVELKKDDFSIVNSSLLKSKKQTIAFNSAELTAISLSIPTSETALSTVQIKVKQNNKWQQWETFTFDEHYHSDKEIHFLPILFDKAIQQFQLQIESVNKLHLNNNIEVRFFYPDLSNSSSTDEELHSHKSLNCTCPQPSIELRNDWCPSGNCPADNTPTATTVSHLVVHHSAGSNTSPNWAATVQSIWDYHVNSNGWDDIGYNYLIDPNGVIYEGRGNDVRGAHFSCLNEGTMGVCLLGNFTTANPSTDMINSLTSLMGWKACDIDKDPRETSFFPSAGEDLINLCGHRDGNNLPGSCTVTECPGDNVYAIMNTIRNQVYQYTQNCSITTPLYANTVILGMNANPTPIIENQLSTLNVEFKNIGDAAIQENIVVDFRIDGTSVGVKSFQQLAVNASDNKSVQYTFPQQGSYQYCVYIDGASNEIAVGNNSYCINLQVEEDNSTAINSLKNLGSYLYPNPTDDLILIQGDFDFTSIEIYNQLGQLVQRNQQFPISLYNFEAGVYILKMQLNNEVISTKIIKR